MITLQYAAGSARLVAAMAICLCAAANPSTSAGQDQSLGEPAWALQPSDWVIGSAYPSAADRRRTPGRGTLGCRVNSAGELTNCTLLDESPDGAGFGRAGLFLSTAFRVEMSGKGARWKGQTISVSIDFTPPQYARIAPDAAAAGPSRGARLVRWVNGPPWAHYPLRARLTGLSGRVRLRCRVGHNGVVPQCSAVDEQPKGLGFGLAAEQGVRNLRVSSKTLDGSDTEGLTLEITQIINPPCLDQPQWDRDLNGCSPPLQPFRPDMDAHPH
jgi:hypothetical protein